MSTADAVWWVLLVGVTAYAVLAGADFGAGFAFHKTARRSKGRDLAERLFGLSSLLTPFFMGTVVGAVASGRVPVGNATGDPVSSWLNPLSLVIGALFVATCAYLAAVFLVSDARRAGALDLERYFSTRALAAGFVAGALAVAGIVALRADARYLYDGLTSDALPLVIVSVLCGGAVLVLLRRGARRGARPVAVAALAAVAKASYGKLLLAIVAAGTIAFGAYSIADARYRRV